MKKLMWIVCLLVVSVTAQAQFEKVDCESLGDGTWTFVQQV